MMGERIKNRFQIAYESGALGSYLVLKGHAGEKVYQYQVEMIANNHLQGILELDVRQKNDTLGFYYNITSRQPLLQFLKRKRLTAEELAAVLRSIVATLLEARNYLLKENLFLLEEEFMYINPNTLEVSMVYVPVELEGDYRQNVKEFMVQLVMFTAEVEESGNAFIQKVLIDVKREAFTLPDFFKLLSDKKDPQQVAASGAVHPGPEIQKEADGVPKPLFRYFAGIKQGEARNRGEQGEIQKPEAAPVVIPGVKEKRELGKERKAPENGKKQRMKYRTSTQAVLAISQAAVLLILILTFKSGALDSLSSDTTTTYGAFALILGAGDFLVIRRLLDAKNRTVMRNELPVVEKPAKSFDPLEKSKNTQWKSTEKQPPVMPVANSLDEAANTADFRDATALLSCDGSGTTPLAQDVCPVPHLLAEGEAPEEKILINKSGFVVGRLRGQADYISKNHAVGKMHAEFIERVGTYYIKDLNSRNGTFVNDIRIDSNIEYEIRDKDRIMIANSRFVFHLFQGQ